MTETFAEFCGNTNCEDCELKLTEINNGVSNCEKIFMEKHDAKVREEAIEKFADWLVKQGILGNRVISDGEITDYGKVYANKFKEQLKEKKNDN